MGTTVQPTDNLGHKSEKVESSGVRKHVNLNSNILQAWRETAFDNAGIYVRGKVNFRVRGTSSRGRRSEWSESSLSQSQVVVWLRPQRYLVWIVGDDVWSSPAGNQVNKQRLKHPHHCVFQSHVFVSLSVCLTRSLSVMPRGGELRTQKLKSHLVRTQSLNVLALKSGVGQHIARHATLTARNFFLAYFLLLTLPVHSPAFFQNLSRFFSCVSCG